MGIKVSLEHRTAYSFDRLVEVHPHEVRLRPAPHSRTPIVAYSLEVSPAGHYVNWQQDAFGNFVARLVFPERTRELSITVGLIADLEVVNPFDFFVEDYAEYFPFAYPAALAADLEPYLRPVADAGELVREWVRVHRPRGRMRSIDGLVELNYALRNTVDYTVRMEPGVQTPEQTLRGRLGSCRDSAWLLVAILRELGLAARFVSGYLVQLTSDTPALDGPSGPSADFTDLHAWTEVYLPGAGWVGMDPTSGLFAGEGHIPLAATPHPGAAAPITGATGITEATLEFSNVVRRVHEDPRVTLPYTDSQWTRITASGAAIDARMAAADVGLTMGGEPTFVSIDDQMSPQWTTDADGPHKRERAVDLTERLRARYAPTGIVQYRQGKWYPGEPLPRWEIAIAWRADGHPIWTRQNLLADPWTPIGEPVGPDLTAPPGEDHEQPDAVERGGELAERVDAAVVAAGVMAGHAVPVAAGAEPHPAVPRLIGVGGSTASSPAGDVTATSATRTCGGAEVAARESGCRAEVAAPESGGGAEVIAPESGGGAEVTEAESASGTEVGSASGTEVGSASGTEAGSGGGAEAIERDLAGGERSIAVQPRNARVAGAVEVGIASETVTRSTDAQPQNAAVVETSAEAGRLASGVGVGAGDRRRAGADHDDARAFAAHIADALGLPSTQVRAAYEDPLARLAATVGAPEGEPPEDDIDPGTDSPETRREFLARLDAAVSEPSAFVIPLHRRDDGAGWASADWRLRRGGADGGPGRIVLAEGDSPAGLRLPLHSLSWHETPVPPEADPLFQGPLRLPRTEPPAEVEEADFRPTTALVAEVRAGRLHVFLPPVEELDDFLDLLAKVEQAAAAIGQPVVLEGYAPPGDARLHTFSITPDPGVIEVNIMPTTSFAEQAEVLGTLYEQARLARLSTESFDVDGTHGGTGGGNHITLGGTSPARSPLLRRPDLLVSMLTYWQRHPALSYLFAGRFVGPTSQAPRADEGREDALYELEIAFAEIARLTAEKAAATSEVRSAPWHIDRALRHLLTDLTGNTHRAEFCVDKLYSPDSARGRLGLLELRGFEMPPHFQMAMVQSLLVRGLVAMFWDKPYRAPLIRHGANLHGRYLLPHFLTSDIAEVAADLRAHGIDFDTSWLDPFTEFRFPRIGTTTIGGVELELRGAIEPWLTLGEQSTEQGTARYVDSSVERLQVRVVGADRDRYVLTCNGMPVPLLATDKADVQVAGVRYRAWQPPNSLHPSITVDAPLVFDLVDPATGLSHGGCTYHVVHPGGRAFDDAPVNAVAAQSRRNRRFEATGHTVNPQDPAALRAKIAAQSTDIGAPGILDLRRARTVWDTAGHR
ncbi:transglutaminase family protein [Nocardia sp. AG03]|uniref:transglutaminase family protein n=1 Tax=Nocardia sp. AG03 TaxID=3025312 RepID=UPI0024189F45|nr:transglutaminase family protein [Nocardia sp. AG03]